ncbi:MAG TPA: alpha-glucan family phosphorylase [Nitrososphaerales archaeon]|nr:alpha-glucan family phosphorylase [Nitrososphaerales archaeon]
MNTAIFVMEIGLESRIHTYSGGLGVLAGDMAYSFADLGHPATFVTILSRNGYSSQKLDSSAGQIDAPEPWDWKGLLSPTGAKATMEIWGRPQTVGAWEYRIKGKTETSVLFLDVEHPENDRRVREATDRLYGGEPDDRLIQDIILGVGGYRVLKALGRDVDMYHLNESHAALATIELLREAGSAEAARRRCAFTTHTPVAAGNDVFQVEAVEGALMGYSWVNWREESSDGVVNLSRLASKYSGVTSGVSMKHSIVAERVIGHNHITYVTNGAYHRRWVNPELGKLFDENLQGWEDTPSLLGGAVGIPSEALSKAHAVAKRSLVDLVNLRYPHHFDESALTICIAKRITGYKRNGMILGDLEQLQRIAEEKGKVQVVFAGRTHPRDASAKGMLAEILRKADLLNRGGGKVKVAVLENYDIEMAKVLVAGADVWLNNPRRPLEACGTSGIKAAMNGVLNLSVYDGWWLEGGIEGVNGWGVGRRTDWSDLGDSMEGEDEASLYSKLSSSVLPAFYHDRERWVDMQKRSIATVGPLFNSYRMVEEYFTKVYARAAGTPAVYSRP